MNRLDKLFLRIARSSSWKMRRTAQDGQSSERTMARACLRLTAVDFNKNHGEGGRFASSGGGGGGGSSSGGGSEKKSEGASKPKSNMETLSKREAKRAHEVSNAISSGKAKLRESGMRAHMPTTPEYRKHSAEMAASGLQASHFSEDYKKLAPEIQTALKNREAHYVVLRNGDVHAKIDLGRPIGTTYGKDGKSKHETSVVTVVHSSKNNDWHFYPDDD